MTAVRPPARFGGLVFDGDLVTEFTEKPQIGEGWINGGFLVFEPALFDYLDGDATSLEADALERLAEDRQLRRTGTSASGSAWTRSATSGCSSRSGRPGTLRGRRA